MRWLAGCALMLLAAPLAAQSPAVPPAFELGAVGQSMPFDQMARYLVQLLPPGADQQVRSFQFENEDGDLAVSAEVRLAMVPGLEMLGGLGWQRLRVVGPVSILAPGFAAWDVRNVSLSFFPLPVTTWRPLLQKVTGRTDTLVPVPVAAWVKRVVVDSTQLVLY